MTDMSSLPHLSLGGGTELQAAIRQSRNVFLGTVWPLWAEQTEASRILSTEDSDRALEESADLAGTDGFFIHHRSGVLVPIASRIEYYHADKNNPFRPRYWDHYPRFTVRLAKARSDGSLATNVECRNRLLALDDAISRRYLPLYTFQSLVASTEKGTRLIQTSRVRTEELFSFVRDRGLDDPANGKPSRTFVEGDVYRIITVEKLRRAGIEVETKDYRTQLVEEHRQLRSFAPQSGR